MHTFSPIPNLSIIVAIAQGGAIGANNQLLCHLRDDLRHFKALTSGHTVLMGRRTWESLPKRPLPKRRNIVVTHQADYRAEGAEVALSIMAANRMVQDEEETFVMGGEAIYKAYLPLVRRIYTTEIDATFAEADAFFPAIDASRFGVVQTSDWMTDDENGLRFRYVDYALREGAKLNHII